MIKKWTTIAVAISFAYNVEALAANQTSNNSCESCIKPEVLKWVESASAHNSLDTNNMQYTLSIIKPDAVKKNLASKINKQLKEEGGLRVVQQKRCKLSKPKAEELYGELKDKSFYEGLINFMISGEIVIQVLSGPNAISTNRKIMGTTKPANAQPGTIRNKFGTVIPYNCIHGSDSIESAKREIGLFFKSDLDICKK